MSQNSDRARDHAAVSRPEVLTSACGQAMPPITPRDAYAIGYSNGMQEGYDEAIKEKARLRRIEAAAIKVAETLNGGFVVCSHCGEQETTTDLDYARELYAALGFEEQA